MRGVRARRARARVRVSAFVRSSSTQLRAKSESQNRHPLVLVSFLLPPMAANPPPNGGQAAASQQTTNIITALGNAFKSQTGDPLSGEHIAQLLIQNMSQLGELAKQGKLTQQQINQVCMRLCTAAFGGQGTRQKLNRFFHVAAETVRGQTQSRSIKHCCPNAGESCICTYFPVIEVGHPQPAASTSAAASAAATPTNSAFKTANPSPFLSASPVSDPYPISQTPSVTSQGPVQWQPAQQGRPSLTGGIPSGRVTGAYPYMMCVCAWIQRRCVLRRATASREAGRLDGAHAR